MDNASDTGYHCEGQWLFVARSGDSGTPHRFLLEADFGALGDGPTSNRLLWLANMDSAILAATLAELGTLTGQAVAFFADDSGVSCCY
jgi:hypothetical protein